MSEQQRPAWMGGSGGNNVWRWYWEDKNGYSEVVESRGPTSEQEMRDAAEQILRAMTRKAIASGAGDPGLKVTDVYAAGSDYVSPVGAFRPVGSRPLDIDRYTAPPRETAAQ